MQMPRGIRALTAARVTTTPLSLCTSTQSLSLMPMSVGVAVVHPRRLDAARERRHAVVVAVGRVDVPLAVRRQVAEHFRRSGLLAHAQVAVLGGLTASACRWAGARRIAR